MPYWMVQEPIANSIVEARSSHAPIARRHAHYVFGAIQSGLTSLIASGFGSAGMIASGGFLKHWMLAWLTAWAVMLPIVLLAAPIIRRAAVAPTREDGDLF
jgi:Protein of unknown function (DUF2798)